jgi:mono/diheme cytochrome c family protein
LPSGVSPPAPPPAPAAARFDAVAREPFGLDAAREAYRRHELRRQLRFHEAVEPGFLLRATAAALSQGRIDAGRASLDEVYEVGRLLFEHEYSFADGLGSGAARRRFAAGENPLRRVHEGRFGGPETTTCASCHWRGGAAGAGALQDASFLYGDGDHTDSADARNPPPLQGVGAVELLAREMTEELQATREGLVAAARRQGTTQEAKLTAKGVGFGVLRALPDGKVDTALVEGVDADLVVKPFGWKGTFATARDFVVESLQVHFGIQSEDLVHEHRRRPDPELAGAGADPDDPDGDGVVRELTSGQLTALVAYLAMLELPVVRPPETLHGLEAVAKNIAPPTATVFLDEWRRGRELFEEVGCASCHTPVLVLKDPVFRTRSRVTGGVLEIDLSRQGERPRLRYDARLGGYPVWLFSDLKRHDLGGRAASRHVDHGVTEGQYLTRRLWGLAKSPPYFYDGHAPWLDHAIDAHLGEAAESRKAYLALGREEKGALRVFLLSLRRERRLEVP